MSRQHRDVLSLEWVRLELVRTAYATRGGVLAAMDPRAVLAWYVLLALAPWFTHNLTVLGALFAVGAVSVLLARVGPLVLGLFGIGLVLELAYIAGAAWLFGGDAQTVLALVELTLKLGTVSLASMAAFVSLDPEKLSDALLAMRAPTMLAFGVSYGYRMLPLLVDEFSDVVESYRLRTPAPAPGFLAWRSVVRLVRLVVLAFYPVFLNTAQSVRTTVEALETRGFTSAVTDGRGRRLRVGHLQVTGYDVAVIAVTAGAVAVAFWAGAQWPLFR